MESTLRSVRVVGLIVIRIKYHPCVCVCVWYSDLALVLHRPELASQEEEEPVGQRALN